MLQGYILLRHYALVKVEKINNTWQLEEIKLDDKKLECMAIDPFNRERIYVGTFNNGLWLSEDAGISWKPAGHGIKSSHISAVVVSPTEVVNGRGIVWVGTEPSELYRSENGGETWIHRPKLRELPSATTWSFPPRPHTHHIRWIEPNPVDENKLFVGIELGGVMRSEDKGKTWEDRKPNSQYDCHTMTTHPQNHNYIYEAAGGGFAFSQDGGDTWETDNNGLNHYNYLVNILVAQDNPTIIIVSAARRAREAYNAEQAHTVIMKKVGNDPWHLLEAGLPEAEGTTVSNFAHSVHENGVFYATNNKGIYKTNDYGDTWQPLPVQWPREYESMRVKEFHIIK